MLSVILVVSTIVPNIDVPQLFIVLSIVVVGLAITFFVNVRAQRGAAFDPRENEDRETWRMPPIALLTRPVKSRTRLIMLCTVRGYAIIAMALLLVKAIQLATRARLVRHRTRVNGVTHGRPGACS